MIFYRYINELRKTVDIDGLYGGPLFLCGGHPSLKDKKLKMLGARGITSMAMNNTGTLFKPDMWVGADDPNCYSKSILSDPSILKFAMLKYSNKMNHQNTLFYNVEIDFDYKRIQGNKLFWWRNIFMISLQLGIILGFDRIYLCGTGFSIDKKSRYAYKTNLNDEQVNYSQRTYNMALDQFKKSLPFIDTEIISCTEDSPINDYIEFVEFEKAIRSEASNIPNHDTVNVKHSSENRSSKK